MIFGLRSSTPGRVVAGAVLLACASCGDARAPEPASAALRRDADAYARTLRLAPWAAPFLDPDAAPAAEELRPILLADDATAPPLRTVAATGPRLDERVLGRAIAKRGEPVSDAGRAAVRRGLRAAVNARPVAMPLRPAAHPMALWTRGEAALLLMKDPLTGTVFLVGGWDRVVACDPAATASDGIDVWWPAFGR